MILIRDLRKIAKTRLKEAEILFDNRMYEGAFYLCGYAVEIALKARICVTLKWLGFPEDKRDFEYYSYFHDHNLVKLLRLTSRESKIMTQYRTDWNRVKNLWSPKSRYNICGTASKSEVQDIIISAKILVKEI